MEGLKIIILNGSPKGMMSVTMQYARYLEKRFPQHSFSYINAAQAYAKFERNEEAFDGFIAEIEGADLILWAYPLYFLCVCSQYKRFIELIFERNRGAAFAGKYTAAISTSIHFFDNTALNYIHGVCDDLGMKFAGAVTAKMDDLQDKHFRESFDGIFLEWERAVRKRSAYTRIYAGLDECEFIYQPRLMENLSLSALSSNAAESRVCIVGDLEGKESNIRKMVSIASETAVQAGMQTEVIDLGQLKFGPCTGCLKCGFDNICAYEGKDDFIEFHRGTVLESDIIIFAGEMHDRYLSSKWQRYLDRSFNKTHQLTLKDKQIGFLISGPLSQNHNAREILQSYVEVNKGLSAGFVSDESADIEQITSEITDLVSRLITRSELSLKLPQSFLGVGGTKIFRDDVFSHLKFVFQVDHKYYKKNGIYDFPQKKFKQRLMSSAAILLTLIPPMRKVIRQQLRQGMIRPYEKLFSRVKPLYETNESGSKDPLVLSR